jgi:hypothetical protein
MFEQDYFMRMIMQVTHYIARVIRLRQEQKPEHALLLLGKGYEFFFGMSAEMVERMSVEELYEWLDENGRDHDEVMRALFEFMQTHVELLEVLERDEDEQIVPWRLKKAELFLFLIVEKNRVGLLDLADTIERDLGLLVDYELPGNFYSRSVRYFEMRWQFARAEDVLHDWRDCTTVRGSDTELAELKRIGAAFYERLLEETDDLLTRGGLPRDEVEFGLQHWLTGWSQSA